MNNQHKSVYMSSGDGHMFKSMSSPHNAPTTWRQWALIVKVKPSRLQSFLFSFARKLYKTKILTPDKTWLYFRLWSDSIPGFPQTPYTSTDSQYIPLKFR